MPSSESRPSSALGPPSSTTWRRQRLLRIGSYNNAAPVPQAVQEDADDRDISNSEPSLLNSAAVAEGLPLRSDHGSRSYGTLPTPRRGFLLKKRSLRDALRLPDLSLHRTATSSNPSSPTYTPSVFRELAYSRLSAMQRPISAYDAPFSSSKDEPDSAIDAKVNGIRVWYSSFSSIDWLHDAIKDSVRFSKLRKRKSVRARLLLLLDKSLGWVIVTIVGFLTAVVAFLVVRSEQWLFDSKEGYCREGWWRAKRFCCPVSDDGAFSLPDFTNEEGCPAWELWTEVLSWKEGDAGEQVVEYISYTIVAVSRPFRCTIKDASLIKLYDIQLGLAFLSCILTIFLTNSTTFITRKESGVLAPEFSDPSEAKPGSSTVEPKRKVMYYVSFF